MSEDIRKSDSATKAAESKHKRSVGAKRAIAIVSLLVFVALMVWVTIYVGIPLLKELFGGTQATEEGIGSFKRLVEQSPIKGRLVYIGIQILQVFVALIPGEVVEIAGGLAFGAIEGMALSLLGVAIASSIVFLLTKTLGVKFVELFVEREKIDSFKLISSDNRLNSLVFLVFFIPGTPKDMLTYLVGLTRMKLGTFLMLSLVARIPSVISSTWGGEALMKGDYKMAIIIFGVTAVVSAIGLLIYNRVSKKKKTAEQKSGE